MFGFLLAITGIKKQPKPGDEYQDEAFCDHCDEDTQQLIRDSQHERDSSGDYRKCLKCGWIYSGYSGEYSEPYTEDNETE